ncbi:HAD family hydrolase [Tropicimonas sp.]|uniref:HAD family hydrolase n=1 Tax=Tropicimonas sp. TaxID=2067044 RepID=UPI003A85652E
MGRYRGLLFDKDGTLFDFQKMWGGWTSDFLLDLAGGDTRLADELAGAIRLDRAQRRYHPDSPVIAGTSQVALDALLPKLPGMARDDLAARMSANARAVPPVEAVPLRPLLRRLGEAGYIRGLATNDDESVARTQLGRVGVLDLFDFVAGSDSGYGAKPAPGQCTAFAEAQGLAADEVVMIGDSTHDLFAARSAGMVPVAVLTGTATAGDLAPHSAAVLADIGELPAWLGLD